MILTDSEIKAEIMTGRMTVTPYDQSLVNPTSLDVRLGNKFTTVHAVSPGGRIVHNGLVDPTDKTTFTSLLQTEESFILHPRMFVLGCLLEDITLPKNISCKVLGKSSLGRLGIENSSCAGWVDAGWSGVLTIELFNYSDNPIKLTAGMKIGQLIFMKHKDVSKGYGEISTSKYFKQEAGQGSKGID